MKNKNISNIKRGRFFLCILGTILVTHMIDREFLLLESSKLLKSAAKQQCVKNQLENTRPGDEDNINVLIAGSSTGLGDVSLGAAAVVHSQSFPPSVIKVDSKQELPSDETASPENMSITGGGLFYCGYTPLGVGRTVFPEYAARYEGGYDIASHKGIGAKHPRREPQSNDILIFGLHGPCSTPLQHFPGKVLVMNGEPNGGDTTKRIVLKGRKPSQDIYQSGTVPNNPAHHTLNVYFFAWVFIENYFLRGEKQILRMLWDHSHKPINTGLHNAVLYANSGCHPHRENAINEISTILPVHVGGKCQGARPHKGTFVQARSPREWTRNFEVQKDYKFCFAMENTYPYQPNYITEKILNPFLAGCIPIYYGTPQVFEVFNRKAVVYYDPKNPAPALQQISELYHNETAYQEMLHQEPVLVNDNATLKEHFSLLDEIEGGHLKHKIRSMMGVLSHY